MSFKAHLSLFLHWETSGMDCKSPLGALFVFSVKMCICVIGAHTPLPTSSTTTTITSAGHLGGVCNEGARAAPKAEGDMGDYMCIPVLIWCQAGRGQCREHAGPGSGQWLILFMCGCVRVCVCWKKKKRGDKRARALWTFYFDSGCD